MHKSMNKDKESIEVSFFIVPNLHTNGHLET